MKENNLFLSIFMLLFILNCKQQSWQNHTSNSQFESQKQKEHIHQKRQKNL